MITVMGAGAFGTGLAISLAARHEVTLWARNADHADEMRKSRQNARRLPDVSLPDEIKITSGTALDRSEAILLAIPTQKLRAFLDEMGSHLPANAPLIACCKGIEIGTGLRPSQIIAEALPKAPIAILTGPSFAADIARGLPTALTLACTDSVLAETLQTQLSTPNIRLYRSADVTGAELGGALKNIIAIACGVAIGAGLGDSARAALMTRGFSEMVRMAKAMGADPATLTGLSGFGDLVLTCSSGLSRNYRAGLAIGREEALPAKTTIEGISTAMAVNDLAEELDLPVTRIMAPLVSGELKLQEAIDLLFKRPLKEE
ncbi:MAG: NAD(P)H-dependent glycerol-3-phosphate dehydrogenase [Pseudomonadota bacterium]